MKIEIFVNELGSVVDRATVIYGFGYAEIYVPLSRIVEVRKYINTEYEGYQIKVHPLGIPMKKIIVVYGVREQGAKDFYDKWDKKWRSYESIN